MRLSLIGMPASGKTTLGRALAVAYGVPFIDLDEEIVRQQQRSIAEVFSTEGEAHFRELEAATLREVLTRHPAFVLATGGGTPCFHGSLDVLLATGPVLYLDVPVPELVRRVQAAAQARPLLAGALETAALEARLHETLAARSRFYDRAHLRYAGHPVSVAAVQQLLGRYLATA